MNVKTLIDLALMGAISFISLCVLALVTLLILPRNFFDATHHYSEKSGKYVYAMRLPLGLVLLTAGLIMLVTPGPGILACLAGFALIKNRHPKEVMVQLVRNYNMLSKFNSIRALFRRKPFTAHNQARLSTSRGKRS